MEAQKLTVSLISTKLNATATRDTTENTVISAKTQVLPTQIVRGLKSALRFMIHKKLTPSFPIGGITKMVTQLLLLNISQKEPWSLLFLMKNVGG